MIFIENKKTIIVGYLFTEDADIIFKYLLKMFSKIFIVILAIATLQASATHIQKHDEYTDTCFYFPIGNIPVDRNFNYTITQAWTAEQAAQLKSGALNTSHFIDVKGWRPYDGPNRFFSKIAKDGEKIQSKLTFVKNVLQGSDAPQFYLSTPDLQFAYGNPSQAKVYKVPSGKALITVRFQAAVPSNPFIGRWSVIVDLVDSDDIQKELRQTARKIRNTVRNTRLTPEDVTGALNIIPSFVENSIFWTLPTSPAQGTVKPVEYQGFVEVIRAGQEVLTGPINDGQPRVIQVKDVVSNRSSCE